MNYLRDPLDDLIAHEAISRQHSEYHLIRKALEEEIVRTGGCVGLDRLLDLFCAYHPFGAEQIVSLAKAVLFEEETKQRQIKQSLLAEINEMITTDHRIQRHIDEQMAYLYQKV
jgi:hypothetical protein